jgi:hypothetical protein
LAPTSFSGPARIVTMIVPAPAQFSEDEVE